MASYIPASYAGRDFDTRSAAYNQQWSNDDCLSSNFTTESKSYKKLRAELGTERQAAGNRAFKPAMSEKDIEARITEIQEKRKKNKLARAAAAQGGATGKSHGVLKLERRLADLEVLWKTYLHDQTKAKQKVNEQKLAEYESERDLLLAKIDRAKLDHVQGAGNNSGKKKKKRVKVPLDPEQQKKLDELVNLHIQSVRSALDDSSLHSEYSAKLHEEFVKFAREKLEFYKSLPDSPAKKKKVGIVQEYHDRCAARPVDDSRWPNEVFTEFKRIMNHCREEVEKVRSIEVYTSKGRSEKIKELRKERTKEIKDLLDNNGLNSREQVLAQR